MNDAQIKYMAEQFLRWRLPENFRPDGGIIFTPAYNNGTPEGGKHEPVGTNLLDYSQAKAMVLHMLEGLPTDTVALAVRIQDSGDQYGVFSSPERASAWGDSVPEPCVIIDVMVVDEPDWS